MHNTDKIIHVLAGDFSELHYSEVEGLLHPSPPLSSRNTQSLPQAWEPAAALTRPFPEPISLGAGVLMGPMKTPAAVSAFQARRPVFDCSVSQVTRDLLFTPPNPILIPIPTGFSLN